MKPPALRVLVAGDEPHIRKLMSRIVGALGSRVVAETGDGEHAVHLIRAMLPDVAILDINMSSLGGDEVLAKAMRVNPRMIAVMITAQDALDSVQRCLDLGARDYILKSNSAEEIHRLLAQSWPVYTRQAAMDSAR